MIVFIGNRIQNLLWAGCRRLCPLLALRYPCSVYDFSLTSLGLHFFTCGAGVLKPALYH